MEKENRYSGLSAEQIKSIAENYFINNETRWLRGTQKEDTIFGFRIGYVAALQQSNAIGFAEFISSEGWQQYDGKDRWICPQNGTDVLSTKDLFKKYLKEIDKF